MGWRIKKTTCLYLLFLVTALAHVCFHTAHGSFCRFAAASFTTNTIVGPGVIIVGMFTLRATTLAANQVVGFVEVGWTREIAPDTAATLAPRSTMFAK